MTDELQEPIVESEPKAESPAIKPDIIFTTPKKSNNYLWIIVGIVVAVICICSILCVAIIGVGGVKTYAEKAPIESVLDSYMRYMVDKDADSAYALFSPRVQRQIPISKVQEMLEGNNYMLFEGYQSLSVSNLNISATANTNPDFPQGTVAKVTGNIKFDDAIQGSFDGTLEKVNGTWMIYGINVTVPPSKIK
jgi:hypothetical protein